MKDSTACFYLAFTSPDEHDEETVIRIPMKGIAGFIPEKSHVNGI